MESVYNCKCSILITMLNENSALDCRPRIQKCIHAFSIALVLIRVTDGLCLLSYEHFTIKDGKLVTQIVEVISADKTDSEGLGQI